MDKNSLKPEAESKGITERAGARRLRRFSIRTFWDVRDLSAWRTLKRPEGRAPALLGGGMTCS